MAIDRSTASQKPYSETHIANLGFDSEFQLPVVENLEYDPGGAIKRVVSSDLSYAFDYDGNNNMTYLGKATSGAAKSAAVWQIKQFTYDASNNVTDIQYADGDTNFDNIWDDRASLSYS